MSIVGRLALAAAFLVLASGCSGGPEANVLAAGSLSVLLEEDVGPSFEETTGVDFAGEYHGSRAAVRMVEEGEKRSDALVSADAELLREAGVAEWDVVFASNSLGIAYDPDTELGRRLSEGEPWHRALRETEADVMRSDPDVDPLGYRTVQMFELAGERYGEPGLEDEMLRRTDVDPSETHLLASVEVGRASAAFSYRNMAEDHGLAFLDLPDELDFSDPGLSDHYASATYETGDGDVIRGTPVLYAATVPATAENPAAGRRFVRHLVESADTLEDGGLTVREDFPLVHGDAPREVLP